MRPETSPLVEALDRCRERLHALPGVIGTGVGLRDGEPIVEIFVEGRGDDELERAIGEIVDFGFVVVPQSHPADAHARHRDPKE